MPSSRDDVGRVPTLRRPLLTWLVPNAIMALVFPLGAALGTTAFRSAPVAALNVGFLLAAFSVYLMLREVTGLTGRAGPVWWHFLLPLYSLYWGAVVVRSHLAEVKARHGKPPPRAAIAYALALPWALASDVNELVGAVPEDATARQESRGGPS